MSEPRRKQYLEIIGLCADRSNGQKFMKTWTKVCIDGQEEEDRWVKWLKSYGIKMAHPDDGWVNREENFISPSYPLFDDGVEVGDKIALGAPDSFRVVTIVGSKHKFFGGFRYFFQ